jgi:hypothetical protein
VTPAVGASKFLRVAIVIAALVLVVLVARPDRGPTLVFGGDERVRALQEADQFLASVRAESCARAVLREPAQLDDASPVLRSLEQRGSRASRCIGDVSKLQQALERTCSNGRECFVPLAALAARTDLISRYIEACMPVYDAIARVSHAGAACSPLRSFEDEELVGDADLLTIHFIAHVVRIQIALLVERGALGPAARYVTDAMRFADDYGRAGTTLTAIASLGGFERLAETLEELLADPRITRETAVAITRDLDVLIASGPTFESIARAEAAWQIGRSEHERPFRSLDREQGRVLMFRGLARWLEHVERACRGKPARVCAEALPKSSRVPTYEEFEHERASDEDHAIVRERMIEMRSSVYASFMPDFARRLADREDRLHALRAKAVSIGQ